MKHSTNLQNASPSPVSSPCWPRRIHHVKEKKKNGNLPEGPASRWYVSIFSSNAVWLSTLSGQVLDPADTRMYNPMPSSLTTSYVFSTSG